MNRRRNNEPEVPESVTERLSKLDADAWSPEAPPALERDRILAGRPGERPSRRRPKLALRPAVAIAGATLLIIGGVTGVLVRNSNSSETANATTVALEQLDSPKVRSQRAEISIPGDRGGEVHLKISGGRPTPSGSVEEVWFMTDGAKLVSVGTYRVGKDGRADVRFHTAADARDYRYVDVSLEPEDGNPAHSTHSLLRSAPLSGERA